MFFIFSRSMGTSLANPVFLLCTKYHQVMNISPTTPGKMKWQWDHPKGHILGDIKYSVHWSNVTPCGKKYQLHSVVYTRFLVTGTQMFLISWQLHQTGVYTITWHKLTDTLKAVNLDRSNQTWNNGENQIYLILAEATWPRSLQPITSL